MKLSAIRAHLRPYSIVQKRKTTINHAFASALAPCDDYDEERLGRAMAALGQEDLNDLSCVYCGARAETWDHLIGLVKDSELRGYGHQVGNLVPCCRACNSSKGNRDWREFLRASGRDEADCARIERMLTEYLHTFAVEVDLGRVRYEHPTEWQIYTEIKDRILELMAEADIVAERLRLPQGKVRDSCDTPTTSPELPATKVPGLILSEVVDSLVEIDDSAVPKSQATTP
jgi:hypothetical protein